MPKVNELNVKDLTDQLCSYHKPRDFVRLARQSDSVADAEFFNNPRLKPLQEAWAAGRFASYLGQRIKGLEVRLNPDQFPDFCIRTPRQEHEFEFTAAMDPDRRMGDQYKASARSEERIEPYRPGKGDDDGLKWIARAVEKKAKKCYAIRPNLLVYANFEASRLVDSQVIAVCTPWVDKFASLWVLWVIGILSAFDDSFGGERTACGIDCRTTS